MLAIFAGFSRFRIDLPRLTASECLASLTRDKQITSLNGLGSLGLSSVYRVRGALWRTAFESPPLEASRMVAKRPTNEHYETLGLSCAATELEVKEAYYRLAREHHPDHNYGDAEAAERFKEVQMAYEALCRRFAKPKPRKSEQFPFVTPSSSRFTTLHLVAFASCVILLAATAVWAWLPWQSKRSFSESSESVASLEVPTLPSTASVELREPAQRTNVENTIADEPRDSSISSALEDEAKKPVESPTDPTNGVVHASYEARTSGQDSSVRSSHIAGTDPLLIREGSPDRDEPLANEPSTSTTWSPPAVSSTSFDLPDVELTDLDLWDSATWYGYLRAISRTPAETRAKTKSASDDRSGSILEAESSRFSAVPSGTGYKSSGSPATHDSTAIDVGSDYSFSSAKEVSAGKGSVSFGGSFGTKPSDRRKFDKSATTQLTPESLDFSYGKKSSPHVVDLQTTVENWTTNARKSSQGSLSTMDKYSSAGEKNGLGLRTDRPRRELPSIDRSWEPSFHKYSDARRDWNPNADLGQTAKSRLSAKPFAEFEAGRYRPDSEGQGGGSWSTVGPAQPQARAQRTAEWKPSANRIRQHKKSLQPYSAKAPSKLKDSASNSTFRQQSGVTQRDYISPSF